MYIDDSCQHRQFSWSSISLYYYSICLDQHNQRQQHAAPSYFTETYNSPNLTHIDEESPPWRCSMGARDSQKEFKLADAPSVCFSYLTRMRGEARVGRRLWRCRCLLQGILSWHRRRRKFQSDCLFSEGSHISCFLWRLSACSRQERPHAVSLLAWFFWIPNGVQIWTDEHIWQTIIKRHH